MGGFNSKSQWLPPEIDLSQGAGGDVPYHTVSARVCLDYHVECCAPIMKVTADFDQLYSMLGQQYSKGYHMVHFTRSPGNMRTKHSSYGSEILVVAFFRKNTEVTARGRYGSDVSWRLHVEKSWLQTFIKYGYLGSLTNRNVDTSSLVDSIQRNTSQGERLVSVMATGENEEHESLVTPYNAVDLFFEVPSVLPAEHYVYHIAMVPVGVVFEPRGIIYFPDVECDWTSNFNGFLSEGWRLIDIFMDIPMVEQLRTNSKRRNMLCAPMATDALWILEKPASRVNDSSPMYEGTIVEHPIKVMPSYGTGVQAKPDWDGVICDMGSRGWELACVVESRACEASWSCMTIKSLLFFQRPIQYL